MIKKTLFVAICCAAASLVALQVAAAGPPSTVTCGSAISHGGTYNLAANCSGAGITITAANVHLSLNGHTMTGSGGRGIDGENVTGLAINGPGTITGYDAGINLSGVGKSDITNVTVHGNQQNGIVLQSSHNVQLHGNSSTSNVGSGFASFQSTNNNFDGNVSTGNGISGIELAGPGSTGNNFENNTLNNNAALGLGMEPGSDHNVVQNNTAHGNATGIGISVGAAGDYISGNTATGNGTDLTDGTPGCEPGAWHRNHFVTSNQSCIR